jgi:hypothetical protein
VYGAINVYFQNAMSIMEKQGRKGNQAQNSEDEFACQCLSDKKHRQASGMKRKREADHPT